MNPTDSSFPPTYSIDPVLDIRETGGLGRTFKSGDGRHPNSWISDIPTGILQDWVIAKGLDPTKALVSLTREQLEKCFCIENYFKAVKGDRPPALQVKPRWTSVRSAADLLDNNGGTITNIAHAQSTPSTSAILTIIDQKLAQIKSSLKDDLTAFTQQSKHELDQAKNSLSALGTTVANEIKSRFENGELDLKLSPALEQRILARVKSASDELAWNTRVRDSLPRPEGPGQTPDHSSSLALDITDPANPRSIPAELLPYIPRVDPNYHFDPYATRVIRSALTHAKNLYVYGDTGCGKTTGVEQVCAVMQRGISRVNPHDGVTREMFLGGMKLIGGETKFIEGALPRAMRFGLVFLVDEISFLPPNLAALLNPVLEHGGKLYVPETSEWITPHPQFSVFATDNTGGKGDASGQYTGTEVQNTATLDRFAFCLKMDYLPRDKECEMLRRRFSPLDDDEGAWFNSELNPILSLALDIRSAFSRGELALTFSTRKLIEFFDQRAMGFSLREALTNTLLAWLDDDDKTLVTTMIDRLGIRLDEEDQDSGAALSSPTT